MKNNTQLETVGATPEKSAFNYTPAPWQVANYGDNLRPVVVKGCLKIATVHETTHGTQESNALLIAAAPQLLLACYMARQELVFGGDWDSAKHILNLAIKKATEQASTN